MKQHSISPLSKLRSGVSLRGLLDGLLLIAMLVALVSIEPINDVLVRDVIRQNATDQQLSHFADEIVVQSLLCRRFEKDILLNISDQAARTAYYGQWQKAIAALEQAIMGFKLTAVSADDRNQAAVWSRASAAYQEEVLQLLLAIDAGSITRPTEANTALAAGKDSIRSLTETATAVARSKDAVVAASSSAISGRLATSARIITLFILAGCVIWTLTSRQRLR